MAKYLLWPRLDFVAASNKFLRYVCPSPGTIIIPPAASAALEDMSGQEPQIFGEARKGTFNFRPLDESIKSTRIFQLAGW